MSWSEDIPRPDEYDDEIQGTSLPLMGIPLLVIAVVIVFVVWVNWERWSPMWSHIWE